MRSLLVCLLMFALPTMLTAQSLPDLPLPPGTQDRLDQIQKDQNAMLARQARMESDIADLKDDFHTISAKLDAITKALPGKMQATKTWDGQAFNFSQTTVSSSAAPAVGYGSSAVMGRSRLFQRLRIGRVGGCAGGG